MKSVYMKEKKYLLLLMAGFAILLLSMPASAAQPLVAREGLTEDGGRAVDSTALYRIFIAENGYDAFKVRYADIDGNGIEELLLVSSRAEVPYAVVCTIDAKRHEVVQLVKLMTEGAPGNIVYNTETHIFGCTVSRDEGGEYWFYKLSGTKVVMYRHFEKQRDYCMVNGRTVSEEEFWEQSEAILNSCRIFLY